MDAAGPAAVIEGARRVLEIRVCVFVRRVAPYGVARRQAVPAILSHTTKLLQEHERQRRRHDHASKQKLPGGEVPLGPRRADAPVDPAGQDLGDRRRAGRADEREHLAQRPDRERDGQRSCQKPQRDRDVLDVRGAGRIVVALGRPPGQWRLPMSE